MQMPYYNFWLAALALTLTIAFIPARAAMSSVRWQQWSDNLFEQSQAQNKLVILDLEAVWCHWCHVMEDETYHNPKVAAEIAAHYMPVKVDQDSRPDLSNRYEDYGWPATVIFDSKGRELVKRRGYIPPDEMLTLLKNLAKNPKPEEASAEKKTVYSSKGALSEVLRKELDKKHVEGFDTANGAWGFDQKFLDWDSVEYAMAQGLKGDKSARQRAITTLNAQLNLIDPVWGGVYQYSTHGDWKHPHFEKIMQMQAENLRIYSLGYIVYGDQKYLKAARDIEKFLREFLLSPEGAFYTSMDADLIPGKHSGDYFGLNDAERRKRGIPRIDKHIYARENGWAIKGLAYLYMATGDAAVLNEATKAAQWVIDNRSLPKGGFRHGDDDKAGPYLGDNLAMATAALDLYTATADRKWFDAASATAGFIDEKFKGSPGFVTAVANPSLKLPPVLLLDENVGMARFANLLFHYGGNARDKQISEAAMKYLATPEVARERRILVAGVLLANSENATDPTHITVVGKKSDESASALFATALKCPSSYRRIEWYDRLEGALPHMDVEFPDLPKAAAFFCSGDTCSSPAYSVDALKQKFNK